MSLILNIRQCEILDILAEGKIKYKEIAIRMKVSESTIKVYMHNAFIANGCKNKTQLLMKYIEQTQ